MDLLWGRRSKVTLVDVEDINVIRPQLLQQRLDGDLHALGTIPDKVGLDLILVKQPPRARVLGRDHHLGRASSAEPSTR